MEYTLSELISHLQKLESEGYGNARIVVAASDDNGEYLTSRIHVRYDLKSYCDGRYTIVDAKCIAISSPYTT